MTHTPPLAAADPIPSDLANHAALVALRELRNIHPASIWHSVLMEIRSLAPHAVGPSLDFEKAIQICAGLFQRGPTSMTQTEINFNGKSWRVWNWDVPLIHRGKTLRLALVSFLLAAKEHYAADPDRVAACNVALNNLSQTS